MKTEPSPVQPGDMIAGKYRVDRILGMGGMGVVVAATHVELREVRALKFLLRSTLTDSESVERFRREARTVLRLKSEHVARVLDVGKLENGAPYMVMEYLHGSDLGEALKQHGPFTLENAILYVIQAMDAVGEAHAKGIIHRDLKPANLYLTMLPSGMPCVKVLDFGISKISKESSEDVDMTKTNAVLGSPQFMSPEQMRATRDVDQRADIWSLGVILYQLTTGKLPFRGRSSTEIIANMFTSLPDPPSRLMARAPKAFDDIVLRCLRLDAAERFATVADLASALAPLAPPAASFTLERIARYADPGKVTGVFPVSDANSSGTAEDLFTPNPSLPKDSAQDAAETNPSETISSAPTRVMAGAAILSEALSIGGTQVMHGAPNQLPNSSKGSSKGPSKFSTARTNVLGSRPPENEQTMTKVVLREVPKIAVSEPQVAVSSAGSVSNSGTSDWGGTQTLSENKPAAPANRVKYAIAAMISAIVLVLVAAVVISSSGSKNNADSKPAGNGLPTTVSANPTTSASTAQSGKP